MKAEELEAIDLLDTELFVCRVCRREFNQTEGTWLPIGEEKKKVIQKERSVENPPLILIMDLRPPEIITSNEFTCYDCTT